MARMTLDRFTQDVAQALGGRLVTLLVYGSAARAAAPAETREPKERAGDVNTLLVCDAVDADLLSRLAPPVRTWTRAGQPPPLIFTEREWRESADAFPIEYEDIRAAHRILAGRSPWDGITVRPDHVRRQLEHELKGKLVHLRQGYAAYWTDPKRLAATVAATQAGFRTMLRAVLRLVGRTPPASADALVREAAAVIGFAFPTADGLTQPAVYLDAVERTADYVHRMERTLS